MNPTRCRNPGRVTAWVFAAMALVATFFLMSGVTHAADEATADTADAVATEESITADAATTDAATVPSEADASIYATMCTAPAGTMITLDRDHADIFNLTSDASGTLTLRIKENATGSGVMRELEQMFLAVDKSTLTQIPASVNQATGTPAVAYPLGQSGDNQVTVLWPGWDILGVTVGGYDAARFHISYTGPESGRIYTSTSSFTEGIKVVINDGSFDLAPEGDDIDQPYTAYKHVSWLFTRAGRYALTIQASAWTPGNTGAANVAVPACTHTTDTADEASCLAEFGSAPSTDQAQSASAPGVDGVAGTPSASAPAPGVMGTTGTTGTTIGVNPAPSSGACTISGTAGGERCVATRVIRETAEAGAVTLALSSAPANIAHTILMVSIGDSAFGNATDGHFDLGPAIEDGTLVARVKDDRTQPAQRVDPPSLTFALGDAARITAPADLGFVAILGFNVWLIPSTQIAGVPWLGPNSQREGIVTGTTGPVQFTLDAVEGPGCVAVFSAGVLDSGVGEHIFDGPGTGYTLGVNTHVHQNWVFTTPGTYTLTITTRVTPNGMTLVGSGSDSDGDLTATGVTSLNGRPMVSQVVGRIASGKECDLSLATIDADTILLTVVSLTWALMGTVCVWVGAIGRCRNLCKAL